ncbi:MAG: DNA-directed RNA polymerase subunit omega [bacterium]
MDIEKIEKLFSKSKNRYYLLTLVAKRACQLKEEGVSKAQSESELAKPTIISLTELAEDKIQYHEK